VDHEAATAIVAAMPNAAMRDSPPTMRPIAPRNSAAMASAANTAGIPSWPVKKPIVPLKP